MAYDENLAQRLDALVKGKRGFASKKMFGGIGFLFNGNMCVGVYKEFLILRLGPEAADEALEQNHTRQFDITGRAMTGWIMVEPAGADSDADLKAWLDRAIKYVKTLPPK